jgi:hypothetical protein
MLVQGFVFAQKLAFIHKRHQTYGQVQMLPETLWINFSRLGYIAFVKADL